MASVNAGLCALLHTSSAGGLWSLCVGFARIRHMRPLTSAGTPVSVQPADDAHPAELHETCNPCVYPAGRRPPLDRTVFGRKVTACTGGQICLRNALIQDSCLDVPLGQFPLMFGKFGFPDHTRTQHCVCPDNRKQIELPISGKSLSVRFGIHVYHIRK